MSPQLLASVVLLAAAFVLLRVQAGAWQRKFSRAALLLDLAPLLLGFVLFAALSARPLLAAVLVAALAGGLAGADIVKREVLREPVVFADRAELPELVRHPNFYFPFVAPGWVAAGALGSAAGLSAAIWAVPPLWNWSPWHGLAAAAVAVAAFALPGWPPLLAGLRRGYERFGPAHDPTADMARLGMLASFVIHATLARAERPARQAAPAVLRLRGRVTPGPVVMAQLESFFDPRRLHPSIPRDLLPHWDACVAGAVAHGRLAVPTWGANTIRTEFAALTGIGAETLGLDRFNPYERFALGRIDSIARCMRAAGCRTICLHPFDKRFYGRNRAIPALGFEHFVGLETFAVARGQTYVSDAALGKRVAGIIEAEGENLFLFVISVANHGPWHGFPSQSVMPAALRALPDAGDLGRYLDGVRATDAFFAPVTTALRASGGTLLAYGDHQPSLPACFAALDHADSDTDYVLWTPGGWGASPHRRTAEALPQMLLDALVPASLTSASLVHAR